MNENYPITDKFDLSREESVFYVKRNLVDYIWKSANMEGILVTFPDTQMIIDNMEVSGFKPDEIITINNLKHGWQLLLETLDYPTDYKLISQLHSVIGSNLILRPGRLRTIPVRISGTNWLPDMPIESVIKEEIDEILGNACVTDRALSLALYLMRKQIFSDGNKRTALLSANHLLVSHGKGFLSIAQEHQKAFLEMTKSYYESNDSQAVKHFLYDNCLYGF